MGGKQKQGQRTKGNTRPSSSGRSAERLMASGATPSSLNVFSGFASITVPSDHLVDVKLKTLNEEIDPLLDGDFRMLMKKMTKRDTVTRLKALQEFQTLCGKSSEATLLSALPFWPRLFNKLCMDPDRRIREAVYNVLLQFVARVKRSLAPHLKHIMGNWLLGQYDPYAPAASVAKSAFDMAFAEEKQTDALLYCKEEIINVVIDNLFHQTPQTFCDPEVTPIEEMEETYHRVVSSSLSVLGFFLDVVPQVEHEKLIENYKKIVADGKFWKLAKSEVTQVRSSWLKLVTVSCRVIPSVLESHLAKLCPLVLGRLDERDPVIASPVWDAALHILVAFKEWWKHCNVQKAVLPKVFSTLSKCCYGSASLVCPYMLPFLSVLPTESLGNSGKTYIAFFSSLRQGMLMDIIMPSMSERDAMIASFFECLKYVFGKLSKESQEALAVAKDLVIDQLFPVIRSALMEEKRHLSSMSLYHFMADLVSHLRAQSRSLDTQSAFFQTVDTIVWDEALTLCNGILTDYKELTAYSVSGLCSMFEAFVNKDRVPLVKKKSVSKVHFADESPDDVQAVKRKHADRGVVVEKLTDAFVADSSDPVVQCAFQLCLVGCKTYSSTRSILHLRFLSEMSSTFSCNELFELLLEKQNLSECLTEHTSTSAAFTFFERVFLEWFRDLGYDSPTLIVDCAMQLLFGIIKSVGDADLKLAVLDRMCHLDNLCLLEAAVRALLPFAASNDVVQKWFRGKTFNATLVSLLDSQSFLQVERRRVLKTWDVLMVCFTSVIAGDKLVVPDESVSRLLRLLHKLLSENLPLKKDTAIWALLESCCVFGYQLFKNVPWLWTFAGSDELLSLFFKLSFETDLPSGLSVHIEDTWTAGVRSLLGSQGGLFVPGKFFHTVAVYVHDTIMFQQHPVEMSTRVSLVIVKLLSTMKIYFNDSDEEERAIHDLPLVNEFLLALLPTEAEWDEMEAKLSQNLAPGEIMRGNLFFSDVPAVRDSQHNDCDLLLVCSSLTLAIFEELYSENTSSKKHNFDRFTACISGSLNAAAYCKMLANDDLRNGKSELAGKTCSYWAEFFGKKMKALFELMRYKEFETLFLDYCVCRAQLRGLLSAYSLRDFVADVLQAATNDHQDFRQPLVAELLDFGSPLDSDSGLHVIQVLSPLQADLNLKILSTFVGDVADNTLQPDIRTVRYLVVISTVLSSLSARSTEMDDEGEEADDDCANQLVVKIMNALVGWKDCGTILVPVSLQSEDCYSFCINTEVARLLTTVVASYHELLSSLHWDYILCTLGSWIETISELCRSSSQLFKMQVFACRVFDLTASVGSTMHSLSSSSQSVSSLQTDLITEWTEFFSTPIFSALLHVFIDHICGYDNSRRGSVAEDHFLESAAAPMRWIPATCITQNNLKPLLNADWDESDTSTPIQVKTVLNRLCPLLVSHIPAVQLGSYAILNTLMPCLPQFVDDQGTEIRDDASSTTLPGALLHVLRSLDSSLQEILGELKFGDPCPLDPVIDADAHCVVSGFLYAWDLVFRMFVTSTSSEARSRYANYLRDSGLSSNAVRALFNLMPGTPPFPFGHVVSPRKPLGASNKLPITMFSPLPSLVDQSPRSSLPLQHSACLIYYQALKCIPALVREWWKGLDRRSAQIVEKFTTKYVSPLLCSEDISAVQNSERKFDNMTVRARPTTKEVVATYAVDEISFELVVKLAESHPLGAVTIETGRRVGVSNSQWNYWLLQLTTFLMHQNGSILDGLIVWKRNIDKKFEGVEECYVCFYVIHSSTSQLPKLVCHTCKKKFHSSCLYKWFNTSGHSTCPLCRSIF